DDDVHHRQCERGIGAWLDRNMPVCFPCRARAHRVDDDNLRTLLLCLSNDRPQMQVGADGIASPNDDVLRVFETLRIEGGSRSSITCPPCATYPCCSRRIQIP